MQRILRVSVLFILVGAGLFLGGMLGLILAFISCASPSGTCGPATMPVTVAFFAILAALPALALWRAAFPERKTWVSDREADKLSSRLE